MKKTDEIIQKFEEFNRYLESVDTEALRRTYTREELIPFVQTIRTNSLRNLAYELHQITEEMKKEMYPQLNGVYRFPLLHDIEFLTDKQKVDLDKYLAMHKVGNLVYNLGRIVVSFDKRKQLEEWLMSAGVLEKRYAVCCPDCGNTQTKYMAKPDKEKLEQALQQYKQAYSDEVYAHLEKTLECGCFQCDAYTEYEDMDSLVFKDHFALAVEADRSLDTI